MLKTLALLMNHFKLDWKVMQAVMLMTGAVISGSAALSVLHVGEFVPQDLDVYVTLKNMVTVLVYLEEQGYSVQIPLHNSTINGYMKLAIILTLPVKNDTGDKIDLVATTEPHVTHAIMQFHSTCVMNYISYYGIICMYPKWTMRKQGLVKALTKQQVINKYRDHAMVFTSAELPGYCTILINSGVTHHDALPKTEMSRLSQSFWWATENAIQVEEKGRKIPNKSQINLCITRQLLSLRENQKV